MKERLKKLDSLRIRIEIHEHLARVVGGASSPAQQRYKQRELDQRKALVEEYNDLKFWFMKKIY